MCQPADLRRVMRSKFDCAGVACLLVKRGPPAVARLVVAVYVDAVEGVLQRWARSHVFQEGSKLQPTTADRNTAPAISVVVMPFRIRATLNHRRPRSPLGRMRCTVRAWVRLAVSTSNRATQAARDDFSGPEFECSMRRLTPAVTSNEPVLALVWIWADHKQGAGLESGQVVKAASHGSVQMSESTTQSVQPHLAAGQGTRKVVSPLCP